MATTSPAALECSAAGCGAHVRLSRSGVRARIATRGKGRGRKPAGAGVKRRKGKQRGAKGSGPEASASPDTAVDHRPSRCEGCGAELTEGTSSGYAARQVVDRSESLRW